MSGKLDQGLDEIISTQRRAVGGRRQNQRRSTGGRPATTAPIGGVKKTTKQPKGPATKQGAAKAIGANGDSKVVVSNLVCSSRSCMNKQSTLLTHALLGSPRM